MVGDLRRLEIFQAGQHQDENGSVDQYTVDDLQEMAEGFNPKLSCPLAIGHVDSTSPAYGWAKRVWVEGDRLYAEIGECVKAVKRWLINRFYNKVSIEVFPRDHMSNPTPGKLHLARICLLGAAPPAIAGGPPVLPFRFAAAAQLKTYTYAAMQNPEQQLADLAAQISELQLQLGKAEFAGTPEPIDPLLDEDEETLDFASEDLPDEMLMEEEEEDLEMFAAAPTANAFIDEMLIRSGLDLAAASDASGVPLDAINMAISGGEDLTPEDLTAVMDALFGGGEEEMDMEGGDEMAMFSAATKPKMIKQLQKRLAKQESELAKFSAFVTAEHKLLQSERAELERTKVKAFCAQLVKDLKIRPSEESQAVELILSTDNEKRRSYAAGTPAKTQREALMESYENRTPLVDNSTIETGGSKPGSRVVAPRAYAAEATEVEKHRAIRQRMAETGESFREAYRALNY